MTASERQAIARLSAENARLKAQVAQKQQVIEAGRNVLQLHACFALPGRWSQLNQALSDLKADE